MVNYFSYHSVFLYLPYFYQCYCWRTRWERKEEKHLVFVTSFRLYGSYHICVFCDSWTGMSSLPFRTFLSLPTQSFLTKTSSNWARSKYKPLLLQQIYLDLVWWTSADLDAEIYARVEALSASQNQLLLRSFISRGRTREPSLLLDVSPDLACCWGWRHGLDGHIATL